MRGLEELQGWTSASPSITQNGCFWVHDWRDQYSGLLLIQHPRAWNTYMGWYWKNFVFPRFVKMLAKLKAIVWRVFIPIGERSLHERVTQKFPHAIFVSPRCENLFGYFCRAVTRHSSGEPGQANGCYWSEHKLCLRAKATSSMSNFPTGRSQYMHSRPIEHCSWGQYALWANAAI
jgi:hypothetical protein